VHSLKNRLRRRLQKLRQPKYLISTAAGLGYVMALFLGPLSKKLPIYKLSSPADPSLQALASIFTLALFAVMIFQWLITGRRAEFWGTAEIQRLLAAPLRRHDLLHYHIARSQVGIWFGSLLSTLIFGRLIKPSNMLFLLVGIWLLYSFLYFYRVAILLLQQTLMQRGWQRGVIKIGGVGLASFIGLAAALWTRWFPRGGWEIASSDAAMAIAWILHLSESPPAYVALLPLRLIVRPILVLDFFEFALCLVLALLVLLALYAGIRLSNVHLGEISLIVGGESKNGENEGPLIIRHRWLFRCLLARFPFAAVWWKNLRLAGGPELQRALPGLVIVLTIIVMLACESTEEALAMMGSIAAGLTGFLAFFGFLIFRQDLRTDWKYIDLLKSYPLPGWEIVLGEALGPATVLILLGWMLVLIAILLLPLSADTSFQHRLTLGIAVAVILPFIVLFGVLVQNAMMLLFPGWMHPGREQPRGIEAIGERLITSLVTFLLLAVVVGPVLILLCDASSPDC